MFINEQPWLSHLARETLFIFFTHFPFRLTNVIITSARLKLNEPRFNNSRVAADKRLERSVRHAHKSHTNEGVYSRCTFARESEKLPALAARSVARDEKFEDQGMWRCARSAILYVLHSRMHCDFNIHISSARRLDIDRWFWHPTS